VAGFDDSRIEYTELGDAQRDQLNRDLTADGTSSYDRGGLVL